MPIAAHPHQPPLVVLVLVGALALAGCGGGGGGGSSGPVKLASASETHFSSTAPQSFSDSDWGFPTSGTSWYSDHDVTHGTIGDSDTTTYRKRTAAIGTIGGQPAVTVTTESYDQSGALLATSTGAWTVGDNGIVYVWLASQATWMPFAPAHVHPGQNWTTDAYDPFFGVAVVQSATVVSTATASPNGYAGCIELQMTAAFSPSNGANYHFDVFSGSLTLYAKPGVGTAHELTSLSASGTVNGSHVDWYPTETLELLATAPVFLAGPG
jgi:hypothetical protein